MLNSNNINDFVERVLQGLPPGLKNLPKDVETNLRSVLHAAFAKMDLVTREEFDAQAKVLIRTRQKLEQLEKKLDELEGDK